MWNLNLEMPASEIVFANMTQHYIEFSNFVNDVLEERTSKITLMMLPVFILFAKNYVIPFLFNVVFKMNITTMVFKVAINIPIVSIFAKKVLRGKVEEVYTELKNILYVTRKEVHERIPIEPIKAKHLEGRLEEMHKTHLDVYGN
jgi:hypothetical protein